MKPESTVMSTEPIKRAKRGLELITMGAKLGSTGLIEICRSLKKPRGSAYRRQPLAHLNTDNGPAVVRSPHGAVHEITHKVALDDEASPRRGDFGLQS